MWSLIGYPFPVPFKGFQEKLKQVSDRSGLSVYDLRQRFIGVGPALLKRSSDEKTIRRLADTISESGLPVVCVTDRDIRKIPRAILSKSVVVEDRKLIFKGRRGESVDVTSQGSLFIVLGALALQGNDVLRTIRQSTVDRQTPDMNQRLTQISHQHPIVDLYQFSHNRVIRIIGNSFNYAGMGQNRTDSAALNFIKLITLLCSNSSECTEEIGFGFSTIPGCVPVAFQSDQQASRNMAAFTRYSRLMACCFQAGLYAMRKRVVSGIETTDISDTNLLAGDPSLDTSELLPEPPAGLATTIASPYRVTFGVDRIMLVIKSLGPTYVFLTLIIFSIISILTAIVTLSRVWMAFTVLLLGTGFLIHGIELIARKRLIENTPTSHVRSMAMGFVELIGTARQKYSVRLPYLLIPCVYYRYRLMECRESNRASFWIQVGYGCSGPVPFYLEDPTGRVLVDPKGAIIEGIVREEITSAALLYLGGTPVPPNQKVVIDYIPEGFTTYIYGIARPKIQKVNLRKKRVVERLRELKRSPGELKKYDKNRNGRIDPDEWSEVCASIQQQVDAEFLFGEEKSCAVEEVVVSSDYRPGRFYIRGEDEKAVLKNLYYRSIVATLAGLVILVVGLVTVLSIWGNS